MMRRSALVSILVAVICSLVSGAWAKEYIYGTWVGPKNTVLVNGIEPYLAEVEKATGGSLKWKVLAGGQLFGGRATLAGIRDKLADAGGPVIPAFTRKELRAANVVYDLVNASVSPVVMTGAVAETYHLDCPQCKADFRKNNALFLANYATTRFNLLCRKPIKSLADVKGRKMRVVGALGRFIKQVGGVPVGGSPAKAVQAMQRGNIDCIVGPISWLQSFGMWDIAKHVFDAQLAIQPTPSSFVFNRDSWNNLSREERTAILQHAPRLVARTTIDGYMAEDKAVRQAAAKKGITIVKAGDEVRKALYKHKGKELQVIPAIAEKEGVKDPDAIVKAHLKNIAKWEKIHAQTGDDVDKFAKALWDEVYSKLDPDNM